MRVRAGRRGPAQRGCNRRASLASPERITILTPLSKTDAMKIEQSSSGDRVARIEARLRQQLAPDSLDIVDESAQHAGHAGARSGGGHFAATIVSNRFEGLNPIQRHRLVYEALGDLMKTDIHALSVRALTPKEL